MEQHDRQAYWRSNLRLMAVLLTIWAIVSFGAGIIFVDQLNEIVIGGFPLGFWFSQQGSILVFIALIFVYAKRMDALDKKFGADDYEEGGMTH